METNTEVTPYKPPTIVELLQGSDKLDEAFANDSLNAILSNQPQKEWIAEHPYIKVEVKDDRGNKIKVPYKYLPIDKVEYLLRRIFKAYKIEITGQGTAFNGVWVSVRVHYLNPATGEWSFHDGIGASQLQTASGKSAADLANINNGAVSMAFPLAKTLAIKDATDMFGNLFGANLNRRDTLQNFSDVVLKDAVLDKQKETVLELIERATSKEQLEGYKKDAMGYDLMDAYNSKYGELN